MSESATVVTGDGIPIYQAIVIKNALKMYRDHKMQVNRAYTPTRMLNSAGRITGKIFKRGQYDQAIQALTEWIETRKAERDAG